jgi:hypothetical protein
MKGELRISCYSITQHYEGKVRTIVSIQLSNSVFSKSLAASALFCAFMYSREEGGFDLRPSPLDFSFLT